MQALPPTDNLPFPSVTRLERAFLPATFAAVAVLSLPYHGRTSATLALIVAGLAVAIYLRAFLAHFWGTGRAGLPISPFVVTLDILGVLAIGAAAVICGSYAYLLLANVVEFCDSPARLLWCALRFLGEPVAYSDGTLTHYVQGAVVRFRATLSSLGIDGVLYLIAATTALESLCGALHWKRFAWLFGAGIFVVLVRLFWNYVLNLELYYDPNLLRDLTYHPISKVSGIAVMSLIAAPGSEPGPLPHLFTYPAGAVRVARALGGLALATVLVAIGTAMVCYRTMGVEKGNRILIDDLHSRDWEISVGSLSVQRTNAQSLYSFIATRQLLQRKGYAVSVNTNVQLNAIGLTNWDVVVLKTPALSYTDAECQAIRDYVRHGGGLWVIGDHTDLMGMTSIANRLLAPWGVSFNADACNDLMTGYFSEYKPIFGWPHPLTAGLHHLGFLTSCSIECSTPYFESVIPGYNLLSDPIDYSVPSFFGDMTYASRKAAGVLKQCVALRIQAGRVLVLADSTPFSTFCLYENGHDEFTLRCIDYLRRRNADRQWTRRILLAVWMGVGVSAAHFARRRRRWNPALIASAFAGVVVGRTILYEAYEWTSRSYERAGPPQEVVFLDNGVLAQFPPPIGLPDLAPAVTFNSLRMLPYELNVPSRLCHGFDEVSKTTRLLVAVYPTKNWSHREVSRIAQFVESGGALVVIDSQANEESSANQLLAISRSRLHGFPLRFANGNQSAEKEGVRIWEKAQGKGRVVCICDGELLSDQWLGNPLSPANEWQLEMKVWLAGVFAKLL